MINLLPVEEKKKIQSLYRWRIFIIGLVLLSVVSIVGTIALIPSYFAVAAKYATATDAVSATNERGAEEEKKLISIIKDTNAKTAILIKNDNKLSPRDIFSVLIAEKSEGIRFSGFSYDKEAPQTKEDLGGEKKIRIILRGVSTTRQDLLEYIDRLNAKKMFSAVDLPISNFVKEKNLDFTLNIVITQSS